MQGGGSRLRCWRVPWCASTGSHPYGLANHEQGDAQMTEPLAVMLVPGLLASARLYGEQLPVLWR
jgi:hypothetical protein